MTEKANKPPLQRVLVTDIDISFGQLVWLMIKMSIAAIPAAMILGVLWGAVMVALAIFGAAISAAG